MVTAALQAMDKIMPGFDTEIARMAERLLIKGRPIDYHIGVIATKVTPGVPGQQAQGRRASLWPTSSLQCSYLLCCCVACLFFFLPGAWHTVSDCHTYSAGTTAMCTPGRIAFSCILVPLLFACIWCCPLLMHMHQAGRAPTEWDAAVRAVAGQV